MDFVDKIKLMIIPPIHEAERRDRKKKINFLKISDLYILNVRKNQIEKVVTSPISTSPQAIYRISAIISYFG